MSSGLLHAPKLSALDLGVVRSPGPGLGNLLFPIARSLIGTAQHGGVFVKPTIRQLKLGPILRGERDWRTYGNVMRARSASEWPLWARSKLRRSVGESAYAGQTGVTVVYEGLGRQFHDLYDNRDLVVDYLYENAVGAASIGRKYDVAIHIRRGDFSIGNDHGRQSIQVPTTWYHEAWEVARSKLGMSEPRVMLFTDGDPQALRDELDLPRIEFDSSPNALISMMSMAKANLLIGSRSTFSLWGNFLGGNLAIWPKEFHLHLFKPVDTENDIFL